MPRAAVEVQQDEVWAAIRPRPGVQEVRGLEIHVVEPQGVRLANELSRGPREGTQARSAWSSLDQCLAQVLRLGDVDRPQLQVPARAPDRSLLFSSLMRL